MRVFLVNDTSGTSNPGCQGTVSCLVEQLQCSGRQVLSRIPLGYSYGEVSRAFQVGEDHVARFPGQKRLSEAWRILTSGRTGGRFQVGNKRISVLRWHAEIANLTAHLAPLIRDCDEFVVNGEGTIHDDSVGAATLIALCVAAKRLGKTVRVLNTSIYGLGTMLLEALRDHTDDLAVREPVSLRYLQDHDVEARLTADCLFLSGENPATPLKTQWERNEQSRAIYTPGVMAGSGIIASETIARDIHELIAAGYEVFYYIVESEDETLAAFAMAAGARVVPLGALKWEEVISFMKTADLVVSGRYHMNIFSVLANTPFIPLQTNTPKMLGLLELLSLDSEIPIRPWKTADDSRSEKIDLGSAVSASRQAVEQCVALAKENVPIHAVP